MDQLRRDEDPATSELLGGEVAVVGEEINLAAAAMEKRSCLLSVDDDGQLRSGETRTEHRSKSGVRCHLHPIFIIRVWLVLQGCSPTRRRLPVGVNSRPDEHEP